MNTGTSTAQKYQCMPATTEVDQLLRTAIGQKRMIRLKQAPNSIIGPAAPSRCDRGSRPAMLFLLELQARRTNLSKRDICGHVGKLFTEIASALIVLSPWLALMAQTAPDAQTNIAALEQQVKQHLQEQKPQLAIPVLRQIVSLDPKNVNAQANLGVLLHFQDKYEEAIPHLHAALLLETDLWRIQALLGMAEKRTGNPSQALAHLEQAFSNLDKDKIGIQVGLELMSSIRPRRSLKKPWQSR
jgi:tetratricopeptide (TPR) repeat protein